MIELLLQAERLLLHGLVDQAEEIYRRTLEADPRNAIAATGLARVAIERGDDQLAYRLACAALELDPQNAAALRLEARLSEILVTRGEPVERPAWLLTTAQPAGQPTAPPRASDATGEAGLRPSEQAVFARNPSMADHRRVETNRQDGSAGAHQAPQAAPRSRPGRRRGLLRRLLGG